MSDDNQKSSNQDEMFGNIRTMDKDVNKVLGIDQSKINNENNLKNRIKEEMEKQKNPDPAKNQEADLFAIATPKDDKGTEKNLDTNEKKAKPGWLNFGKHPKKEDGLDISVPQKTSSTLDKPLFQNVEDSLKADFSQRKVEVGTSPSLLSSEEFSQGSFKSSQADIAKLRKPKEFSTNESFVPMSEKEDFTRLGKGQNQDFATAKPEEAHLGVDLNIEEENTQAEDDDKEKRYSTVEHTSENVGVVKSRSKMVIQLAVVFLVLILGGGALFLVSQSGLLSNVQVPENIANNTEENNTNSSEDQVGEDGGMADLGTDEESPVSSEPNIVSDTPVKTSKEVKVVAKENLDLRSTLKSVLEEEVDDPLVKIVLVDESDQDLSLEDFRVRMGINIYPNIFAIVKNYHLYGYLLDDTPKLGLMLELERNVAEPYLDSWIETAVLDLAGFSVITDGRLVKEGVMKSVVLEPEGLSRSVKNYYYNYTGEGDNSVDIMAYNEYILIANSKDTMRFMLSEMILD